MHLGVLLLAMILAVGWRWRWQPTAEAWSQRWWRAILALCGPLVVLGTSAWAVLWMGHHGTMLGWAVGPLGCRISQVGLGLGAAGMLWSLIQAGWTTWHWRRYALVPLPQGMSARLVETAVPLAAQVGFWQSRLVVSRGWLDALSPEEQGMILAHEQAHAHHRDPLVFWLLGLVRRLTIWLPNTQALWQELLLLREIRADRWAVQQAHPLAVAELLVKLSRPTCLDEGIPTPALIGFSAAEDLDRLEQRVNALLDPIPAGEPISLTLILWGLASALLPLLAVTLHH
ncbi:Zn-dependent protease with chaperone function [Leptolyngbya sp. BL0902]|uniref:M56 family metallopeptidase n=1 Tax=Leptolyngbya sp. BL0902 TaxID=1115757 RepID=UPI0018E8111D|nr:M56 family metallopeptidase [Leptolyngbya sp. BL0902]QQE67152.1 Zn-dependent protease with chaperone function [Leptolyngbya sp. BL0902]